MRSVVLESEDRTIVEMNEIASMCFFHELIHSSSQRLKIKCHFTDGLTLKTLVGILENLVIEGRDRDEYIKLFCEKLFAATQHEPTLVAACIQLFEVKGAARGISRGLESLIAKRTSSLDFHVIQRTLYDVLKDYLATTKEMSPTNTSPMFYYSKPLHKNVANKN